MNSNLANKLLASIMSWEPQQLAAERPLLEFMGSMKYDSYDRYMPGTRFMSSLVQWLNQIEDPNERAVLFSFVKQRLVFISSTQMNYLVDLLYDSIIRPMLLKKATDKFSMPSYMLSNNKVQSQFSIEKRSSLVIGLSDGAHTDILRRSAGFSNEQVLTNYYPDEKKIKDMQAKLHKDMKKLGSDNKYFHSIYLIDDFTASGKSFVRYDSSDGEYHGKLAKIIEELCKAQEAGKTEHLSALLDPEADTIQLDILFCMATEKAQKNIEKSLKKYLEDRKEVLGKKVECYIHVVQPLEEAISGCIRDDKELNEVLKNPKYLIKEHVITDAYKVGKHNNPHLGFDECALPVVLSHNTPNNSLPILWQDASEFRGLFPRISRH